MLGYKDAPKSALTVAVQGMAQFMETLGQEDQDSRD